MAERQYAADESRDKDEHRQHSDIQPIHLCEIDRHRRSPLPFAMHSPAYRIPAMPVTVEYLGKSEFQLFGITRYTCPSCLMSLFSPKFRKPCAPITGRCCLNDSRN